MRKRRASIEYGGRGNEVRRRGTTRRVRRNRAPVAHRHDPKRGEKHAAPAERGRV